MKMVLPCGRICLYDDEDHDIVSQYNWHYQRGYAQAETGSRSNGTRKTIRMHRLILSPPSDKIVDHMNRDSLDNRRSNLRLCNKSENGMNRTKQANNSTGYKGVSLHKKTGKYRAYITKDQKTLHLGLFETPVEAYRVYLNKAKELHGEFICG